MGSKKIEVSSLGKIASTNIRAQLGIRRMSNRELARKMDRSESYVRARVNDEKEWTLNDLEIISRIWGISPSQLVVPMVESSSVSSAADSPVSVPSAAELEDIAAAEQAKRAAVLQQLAEDPYSLAASRSPHKHDPDPDVAE
ncbi:helix-turn-helix domain-containing protein [Bifidobacterium scaligerum]|uniref:HTH cro/C1-type domain-containing protein n=1 Tax=Bifidobacterium scaligerum TaxID=2052656 RepID=A0A2M9HT29_9BIFI|nr:hypothetical protein [Bifidobacterium scaligerum]PJM79972.1 hypothetical protein CUU80_02225 [Bifidobacterium scaligerum]